MWLGRYQTTPAISKITNSLQQIAITMASWLQTSICSCKHSKLLGLSAPNEEILNVSREQVLQGARNPLPNFIEEFVAARTTTTHVDLDKTWHLPKMAMKKWMENMPINLTHPLVHWSILQPNQIKWTRHTYTMGKQRGWFLFLLNAQGFFKQVTRI